MQITATALSGVFLITPHVIRDQRGYFMESFRQDLLEQQIGPVSFIQENESYSTYGVIRGLHFQKAPYAQSKLIRVVRGRVLDVVVDLRPDAPTFGQHLSVELNDSNHRQLFVPKGFAHGFAVLSREVIFSYKVDMRYTPEAEDAIRFDDPDLGISWPIPEDRRILSDKDLRACSWATYLKKNA